MQIENRKESRKRLFVMDMLFCPDVRKISNFRSNAQNLHFILRTLIFGLKHSPIGKKLDLEAT